VTCAPTQNFTCADNDPVTDPLAAEMVPKLLAVLGSAHLTSFERSVVSSLRSWDYSMAADSTAATAWWTFSTD
jgi:acyl-homoserine lactone acylase PvdQ